MNRTAKTVNTEPLSFDGQGCLMIGHPGNKRLLAQFEDAEALEAIVERYNATLPAAPARPWYSPRQQGGGL